MGRLPGERLTVSDTAGSRGVRDPAFPAAHVRPPRGWVNDPNGPFRWRGRYHLFFQHNPAGPLHGDICWGHASSADLTTWRTEPVALVPTEGGPDSGGCWSGCVVDDAGTPAAVYTGFAGDPRTATVLLAHAEDDDLRRWSKTKWPVAVAPPGLAGFRDPFLLELDGHRYAVVGAGRLDGTPEVLVYRCDDLLRWEYAGVLLDGGDHGDDVAATHAPAEIWECPQLFRLEERWVLVVSLVRDDSLTRVAYLVGDLVAQDGAPRFRATDGGLVDHGHDFYAPAVLVEEARVVLWGWTWEDRAPEETLRAGWAGALTWPRELGFAAEQLTSRPAAEMAGLRRSSAVLRLLGDGASVDLPPGSVDLEVEVRAGTSLRFGRGGPSLSVAVDPDRRTVTLDRATYEPGRDTWPTTGTAVGSGPLRLRVVLDGSVVEVYTEGGPSFTERLYPAGDRPWAVSGSGAPCAVTVHQLTRAVED